MPFTCPYGTETKALNQAVKRNYKRFEGDEFMFQLTPEEWKIFTNLHPQDSDNGDVLDSFSEDYNLRSQFVTSRFSNKCTGGQSPCALIKDFSKILDDRLKEMVM